MLTRLASSDNELWGWEEFFTEINKLLRDLDRHYELCTILYRLAMLYRLELAVSSVARLKDHLEMNRAAVRIHNRYDTRGMTPLKTAYEISNHHDFSLDF